jgi:hypothetical protein
MKKALITATAALCIASAAFAQPYPANGYIGVFSDQAGTQCCATIPNFTPAQLFVIAFLAGSTASGITGAEFRLEMSQAVLPANGSFSFAASPTAGVTIGNPLDSTPGDPTPPATEGLNIGWSMCQGAGQTKVELGTINAIFFNPAVTHSFSILSKRKSPPGNAAFDCPLLTLCDPPAFTKVCLTIPSGPHGESISFRSGVNLPSCDTSCERVAVDERSWSGVKELFR